MIITVMGAVFGIEFTSDIDEMYLGNGRIFKNPIALRGNWDLSLGANITLYKDIEGKRQTDKVVAKYLIDVEIESTTGQIKGSKWVTSVSGSGGITSSGAAGLELFKGLVRDELENVLLPLRLSTKARIIMIPVKLQGGDRNTVSSNGFDQPMPEPYGTSNIARLSKDDCDFLTNLATRISKEDIDAYRVPIEIFQDSFYKGDTIERGLNLFTCLESLLCEGSESIRFKLAYRTSCLLEFGNTDIYNLYSFINKGYKHRSNLVHGNREKRKAARTWFESNMLELENIIRKSLFMMIELRFAGKNLKGEENIDKYIFDEVFTAKSISFQDRVMSVGKLSQLQTLL